MKVILKEVKLENFKCFDNIAVEFSNITLLTGPNSSGKSSLIYSILGAIQSNEFPFQFSPNGEYVNMGDYSDIVFRHKRLTQFKIDFNFQINEEFIGIQTIWNNNPKGNVPQLNTLDIFSDYYKINISKDVKGYNLQFNYYADKVPTNAFAQPQNYLKYLDSISNLLVDLNPSRKAKDIKEHTKGKKEFFKVKDLINIPIKDLHNINYEIAKNGNYYLNIILTKAFNLFQSFNNNISYISSFRLNPERTYYESTKFINKVNKYGENYIDQILKWKTQKNPKYKVLLDSMIEIGLLNDIQTKRFSGGRFEILIQSYKNGVLSSISDVGFGISQFLPILVADLQLSNDSTLIISQPEIHLHPSIQAKFADYIINQIKTKNKRYIIETHSEYLINRFRLSIAKDTLSDKDLKTYYFDNNGTKVKVHTLRFLKNGQIKGAPKGFFDTYMIDVMDIALNAK